MPYASHIQVVNDANGTAHAFLVEDGAIWQCQWNSEAQRWDKGTIVPQALGGEQVQALVLPEFWTTSNSGGTKPTAWDPGLVLAYRVGQGSGSEISGSFGRWNEAGELVWTAPVRLTQDQSTAGEFSLCAGANSSFNLVLQQTAGAAPAAVVLDALTQRSADGSTPVRDQLEAAITSTEPDSDLYNYRFRIDATGKQLEQLATASGSWTLVSTATNPLKAATTLPLYSQPALIVSGNSQITRGDLYAQGQISPGNRDSDADPEPELLGSSPTLFTLGTAGFNLNGKAGDLFAGFKGQDLFRYQFNLGVNRPPGDAYSMSIRRQGEQFNRTGFINRDYSLEANNETFTAEQLLLNSQNLFGHSADFYRDAEWLNNRLSEVERREILTEIARLQGNGVEGFSLTFLEPKASYAAIPSATLRGAFGALQGGIGNLQAISFAKFVIGKGNDDYGVLSSSGELVPRQNRNPMRQTGPLFWAANVHSLDRLNRIKTDMLRRSPEVFADKTYNYGLGGSLFTAYNYGNSDRSQLKSIVTSESVSLDWLGRKRSVSAGRWVTNHVFNISSGFYWQQSLASPSGALPVVAAASGLLGVAVASGLNATALNHSRKIGYKGFEAPATSNNYVNGGAAAFGLLGSLVGPLLMWLDPGTANANLSNGIQLLLRYSGSKLKNGIAGLDWNLISRTFSTNFYSRDPEKDTTGFFNSIDEAFYADAGVRIIGGARVPLFSTYLSATLKDKSSADTVEGAQAQANQTGGAQSEAINFTADGQYPFVYLPTSGNTVFAGSPLASTLDAKIFLLGDAVARSPRRLQLDASSLNGIVIDAVGANLNDGVYPGIRILGVPLVDGSYAKVDVSIDKGQLVGLSNLSGASYLSLPETATGSGKFYLPLDVFQPVEGVGMIATPPQMAAASQAPIALPVLSIRQGSSAGLLLSKLLVFDAVQVDFGGAGYSRLNPSASKQDNGAGLPADNDNQPYVYDGVPLQLTRNGTAVSLIGFDATNPATATVHLVGGSIRRIDLDQSLYIEAANASSEDGYGLQLTLPDGIAPLQQASLSLRASAVALDNLVQDGEFSAQQGAIDTGVFIAEGRTDQLALYSSDGYKRLQNRVVYTTTDANKNPLTVYLNTQADDGSNPTNTWASAADLSNERIVQNTAPVFSFASHPTAISIAGQPNDDRTGWTLVAWVQSGEEPIPYSTVKGAENYQNYLTAVYGNQSINYRVAVKGSATNWSAPDASLNYTPDEAIITNLQAFNLPNPARGGQLQSLLTWSEIKIDAIKGLTSEFGSGLSPPATIKAAWIDADSASIDWTDLGEDVIEIPWDPATSVGIGIADLTASSQTIRLADGSVQQAPMISWSQTVRTPYQQSVLLDQPTVYLPMARLQPGENNLNKGSSSSDFSRTSASLTGLDFSIPGSLAVEQTTAVRNSDGTGVITTGLGSFFNRVLDVVSQVPLIPPDPLPTPDPSGPPTPSVPYSIECWVQLQPGSNSSGAGIVALGQPSATAVGEPLLPEGWTLTSSFDVDRLTYNDAAAFGAITEIPAGQGDALYGWVWNLVADGANTTAMNGSGGSNLYSPALSILNLATGVKISGVDDFLNSYGVDASQLIGLDGVAANSMALVPTTELLFDHVIDAQTNQATSSLNTVALDQATTLLNRGFVAADGANANLAAMFQSLWTYQNLTGEKKVFFDLAPSAAPAAPAASPSALLPESYGGYELGFALWGGPALSVDGAGRIIFDAGKSLALGSGLGIDLRDGAWHAVTATYTPNYITYTQNGEELQLPSNNGTARLFIDGQKVNEAALSNPYLPVNINNQAILLANNAGGAIDQVAFYNQALTLSPVLQPDGSWPEITSADALAQLAEAGLTAIPSTPNPGELVGAVTQHWLARNVNPSGALNATYVSTFLPDGSGTGWQWSQASGLDPVLTSQPTQPSASRAVSVSDAFSLRVSPTDWADLQSSSSATLGYNPSGQTLKSVSVTLTDRATGTTSDRIDLTPEQVLVGDQTIASLQPRSTTPASLGDPAGPQLHYSVLNATPAITLLIPRARLTAGEDVTASYQFTFASQDYGNLSDSVVTNPTPVSLKALAIFNTYATSGFVSPQALQSFTTSQAALATAAVLGSAPLQLKYIDSGIKLSSEVSAAAANNPAEFEPAQQFGSSQVGGSYTDAQDPVSLQRGWLAIAQPVAANAATDPGGRVWIQYTGQRPREGISPSAAAKPAGSQAPSTWLNALANSNFDPNRPNLPLLNDPAYANQSGGLLIKADPTLGLEANLGQTMTSADLDGDGLDELIIASPNANGGGCVYIIAGKWIAANLNSQALTLDLTNPNAHGSDVVTILRPMAAAENPVNPTAADIVSFANFGTALAVDPISKRLWIGAPDYVRELPQLSDQTFNQALQTIGALYSFSYSQQPTAGTQLLTPTLLGNYSKLIKPGADGSATTSYWGARLGAAIAISDDGKLAVSAPGVAAAMEYSGTDELISQTLSGQAGQDKQDNWGALVKADFAKRPGDPTQISTLSGMSRKLLTPVANDSRFAPDSSYMQAIQAYIQQDPEQNIATPTIFVNQALQSDAIGAVYLLNNAEDLMGTFQGNQLWPSDVAALNGATFYGINPWNTLGATNFGSSLAFADLANTNSAQLLIGADAVQGSGAVMTIDAARFLVPDKNSAIAIPDQANSYLGYQAANVALLGASNLDQFGHRLVSLGDVNDDGYDDVLITAPNARGSAGSGYVLFGSNEFLPAPSSDPLIGSVAPGTIGTWNSGGRTITSPILEEIGYGGSAQTGSGSYGPIDVDGDGLADVLLGSPGNGSAYITWGQRYLEAISSLALDKLSSSNGFLLEGLASKEQGSLRAIGDFNFDGYGDFISIKRGPALTTVRLQLGANTQEVLADYPYNFYSFTVSNDTEVIPIGDSNGDGFSDLALFINHDYSGTAEGAGSTTGILYGRRSAELPLGSGFGLLAPEGSPSPERPVVGGLSDVTPAFLSVGDTIYTVVKGVGNTDSIWFNQSRDAGSSWDSWTNLTDLQPSLRTASGHGPSLAWHQGSLVLGLLDPQGQLSLSSWNPSSADLSQWTAPFNPLINGAAIRSSQTPQLVSGGLDLALVWLDPDGHLQTSYCTDALGGGEWLPAATLEERLADGSSAPIRSLTAPSLTPLGSGALAMAIGGNDGSGTRIRVLTSTPSSLRWSEASSFGASAEALATGPSLALTDTGLALTYGTADQGVLLQRLDLLNLDGSSRNTAASAEQLIQQTWQATTLNGLSSGVGTVPLMVNGTLLLGNVRADAQNTQIWLNAIAAPQNPDSTTWLNTTVQLPDGQGGWLVRQQAGADHPVDIGVLDPSWQSVNGGLSPWAPSFAELNNVLYAAVRGWSGSNDNNKTLYWNRSFDNGFTWSSWQQLPSGMTSDRPPTIAAYNNTLYLVYIGQDKSQTLNLTKLDNADTNHWADQIQIRAGVSGASNQTAEFATLVNEEVDKGNQLALYYVGTGNNELYSTSSTDPYNTGKFSTSTLIKYNNNSGTQTASGPLAAARLNNTTYLAYQGGTYQGTKSNTIYLTTGSANSTNWTLINGIPQPGSASHTGVGLAANSTGLVLSYSDVVDALPVVSLQQGTGSGSSWSFSPYSVLERPADGQARYDGANSLFSRTSSDKVLVATIDSGANEAITNAWVIPRPPTLVLTPEQTRSTLTPVGDLSGDGLDDFLVTAANVVQQSPGGAKPQLQMGVRLVSGALSSAALSAANNANASSQTIQLAPAFALDADPASTAPTAAAALGGLPQLTMAATAFGERSRISTSAASQSLASFSASASDPTSLSSLFQGASQASEKLPTPALWGKPQLRSSGFGDLNGDGRPDRLAADGLARFQTANGELGYTLWDIRAAADANGNGLDDVLLAVVPQGPAYKPNADGSPSFIQPVLIDGALFEVDTSTDSFGLDRLKAPLNPYTQAEVFDLNSTSSTDYLPPLQAWINPILAFQPGSLTAASVGSASQPTAKSSSAPQLVVDQLGHDYQLYTSSSSSGSVLANGLWIGYRNADDSWASSTIPLGGRTISAVTPTAAFYNGRLFVAYAEQNGAIHISYSNLLERQSKPPQWSWTDYTVSVNGSAAKTLISPTLVVNHGLLNLIYPGDVTPDSDRDGIAKSGQQILLASSNNPEAGDLSSWGSSFDAAANRFSGAASVLQVKASGSQSQTTAYTQGPVAAAVFQGQTVLAYESMNPADAIGVVLATEPLGSAPGATPPAYGLITTSINDVNGLSLATDQAQLYLAYADSESKSVSDPYSGTTTSYFSRAFISAFAPTQAFPGDPSAWSEQPSNQVGNIDTLPSYITPGSAKDITILDKAYPFPTSFGIAMRQGTLTASWVGPNFGSSIQSAVLDTTVTAPRQQSVAGYSIDGGIDNNGDGFADSLISDPSDTSRSVDNQYALFGGDWLNIATQVGTTGDDGMLGTPKADVIYSLSGADRVESRGGADVILTGAGDDQISIAGNGFFRIDAGPGFDTLQLQGMANQAYDFRLNVPVPEYYAGTKLQSIELISSRDFGANLLAFDGAAVTAFNPNRFLFLCPDDSDSIVLSNEFRRNSNFDTKFNGLLWSAFTAGPATATPSEASPAVIYVLNPEPDNPGWLDAGDSGTDPGITILVPGADLPTAVGSLAAARTAETATPPMGRADQGSTTLFGNGLSVTAFSSSADAGCSHFTVWRQNAALPQVVSYATSSLNSRALPGRDHRLAAGIVVFQPGETSKEILVPWIPGALQDSRGSSLSLEVRELPFNGQKDLHVLIDPLPDASTGQRPALSGISLTSADNADRAWISLRADANNQNRDELRLRIGLRSTASSLAAATIREVAIRDFDPEELFALPVGTLNDLPIDRDDLGNQQVGLNLQLNLLPSKKEPSVSLLGPDFLPTASIQIVGSNQIRFLQEAPLSSWRTDRGTGQVSFALEAGSLRQTLLRDAEAGSSGSLTAANAFNDDPLTGWRSTEGRAVGGQAVDSPALPLAGQAWTPTARRDGRSLALLELVVSGQEVTARFEGGVSLALWQASGSAPTALPVLAQVEVQRLARYASDLGFYTVDGITGSVAGLEPGDSGYLEQALARSRAEGLLLTADMLPAFGQAQSYQHLPLDSQKSYGVLLLPNGNTDVMFSSFAAANPGGLAQMVNLGSGEAGRGMVLGIEDIPAGLPQSDRDFNDVLLKVTGVVVPIF